MDSYRTPPSINDSTTVIKDKRNIMLKKLAEKLDKWDVGDFVAAAFFFTIFLAAIIFLPGLAYLFYRENFFSTPKEHKEKPATIQCVCLQPERAACGSPDDQKKIEKE